MPRGDKSSYTEKQRRQAEHIEEGYEKRGVNDKEAERRAWATVNAMTGGGKASGSGRGKSVDKGPARKGGRLGGAASAARPPQLGRRERVPLPRRRRLARAPDTNRQQSFCRRGCPSGERDPLISLLRNWDETIEST